jgi:hypothetical protein
MTFFRTAASKVRLHDTTHSPIGLWQLQGDLTDSSGNGYTLSLAAGTEQYVPISDTVQGHLFNGATYLRYNTAEAALQLTGDMTIELLVEWLVDRPGIGVNTGAIGPALVCHGGNGETLATNNLYTLGPRPGGGLRWLSESGSGSNAIYDLTGTMPAHVLHHLAAVRSSNVVTFYWNGAPIGTSGTLTTPAGGTSGRLCLGNIFDGATEEPTCTMASVKIIGSALTASQVQAEYERTLG